MSATHEVCALWHSRPRLCGPKLRAFTLIELLVVIAIISLLVTMTVPSLTRAKELARRTVCSTNLRGIAASLEMYGQNNQNTWPYMPLNGAGWNVPIGTARDVAPETGKSQARNPSATLWMLVRDGAASGLFVCPSSHESPDTTYAKDAYDFTDGSKISLAFQNPYGQGHRFNANEEAVPLLSDSSPYFDAQTGLRNEVPPVDLTKPETEAQAGNSRNHGGEGQNIALSDGVVWWVKRADSGLNHDNIYTRAVSTEGMDRAGTVPTPSGDGSASDQGPASSKDSYLVP